MLARVGTAAMVAQPQAYEMAPAAGVRVIDEGGAAVAQRPVVDELDLPGLEVEIDRKFVFVEYVEHCRNRGLAVAVYRLPPPGATTPAIAASPSRSIGSPRKAYPPPIWWALNRAFSSPAFSNTGAENIGLSPGRNSHCRSNQKSRQSRSRRSGWRSRAALWT